MQHNLLSLTELKLQVCLSQMMQRDCVTNFAIKELPYLLHLKLNIRC